MSDKIVRKQIYECSKCGKVFDSKAEADEHYEKVHNFMDKYSGSYLLSKKDPSIIGKVLRFYSSRDRTFVVTVFRLSGRGMWYVMRDLGVAQKFLMTAEEIEREFTVVTADIAKNQLDENLRKWCYDNLKRNMVLACDFSELLSDGAYKKKGDDNGN